MRFTLEHHTHLDPLLPIYFFDDYILFGHAYPYIHWHENIEILHVYSGKLGVMSNAHQIEAAAGDTVIVNSNHIHAFSAIEGDAHYYCLIVDKDLCASFGIQLSEVLFADLLHDKNCAEFFLQIDAEMQTKRPLYQAKVKSIVMDLFVHLYRDYLMPLNSINFKIQKLETIKQAINYINEHFTEPLTIDQICAALGFSKFYFCHMFREITSQTVVDYINYVRCLHAKVLITSGKCNVSEAAVQCGYNNFSYFSKQYKKRLGTLPSKDLKSQEKAV